MTDELQLQERMIQSDEVHSQDVYVNVGVNEWFDKNIQFTPYSLNKEIQSGNITYKDVNIQNNIIKSIIDKLINTEETFTTYKKQ